MRVDDEEATFKVYKSMDFPQNVESCKQLEALNPKACTSKSPRTKSIEIEPPMPSIDVFNAMDPPPKV